MTVKALVLDQEILVEMIVAVAVADLIVVEIVTIEDVSFIAFIYTIPILCGN